MRQGRTFTTTLTDDEARGACRASRSRFAQELAGRTAPITEEQTYWLHLLALEHLEREAQDRARAQEDASFVTGHGSPKFHAASFSGAKILGLFQTAAGAGRKMPRMRFEFGPLSLRLTWQGPDKAHPGSVQVTDSVWPGRTWFGSVKVNGEVILADDAPGGAEVEDFLTELAADPVGVADRHGRDRGACCFCGLTLLVSTVGFGPCCAAVWGLPYDSTTLQQHREAVAARKEMRELKRLRAGTVVEK